MMRFQNSKWLFYKEKDDHYLYRAVPKKQTPLIDRFSELNIIPCVPTDQTQTVGPRSCIIYRVNRLPFQIRIQEVTRAIAKEIVLYLIDLNISCIKQSIAIFDIHESNVLYWNGPIYVDLDSMREANSKLYAGAVARIAYLFNKYVRKIAIKSTAGCYDLKSMQKDGSIFSKIGREWSATNWSKIKPWQRLKKLVQESTIEMAPSHWGDVYGPHHKDHDKMLQENVKIRGAMKLLRRIKPKSVLDVGCNKGYLCDMVSEFSDSAIGFDVDEKCVDMANQLYSHNTKVNFANFGIIRLNREEGFIQQRYSADAVVALAVTHHFKTAGMDAKTVAILLTKLAKKWILIEDIADVGSYHHVFKNRGFGLLERVQSFPEHRHISLFVRS